MDLYKSGKRLYIYIKNDIIIYVTGVYKIKLN